jgi:molybdopterin-guanine dinucleotide biosynthesis protein A
MREEGASMKNSLLITPSNITAIIIAGGKSSRMGRDKALLPFGGYSSLAQFQYQRLQKIFERVYLSAKCDKFDFDAKVIEDRYETSSPLVALLSIFETLEVDEVFVLSVDTPFVDKKVIHMLSHQCEKDVDVVVAKHSDRVQPLCAIYRRSILPLLYQHYHANNHKLHHLLEEASTTYVTFDNPKTFTNLNYFEEYQEALERISR